MQACFPLPQFSHLYQGSDHKVTVATTWVKIQLKTAPNKLSVLAIISQGREICQKVIAIGNSQGNHPKAFNPSEGAIGEQLFIQSGISIHLNLDLGICTIRKKNWGLRQKTKFSFWDKSALLLWYFMIDNGDLIYFILFYFIELSSSFGCTFFHYVSTDINISKEKVENWVEY